jgi:hypothetical protein
MKKDLFAFYFPDVDISSVRFLLAVANPRPKTGMDDKQNACFAGSSRRHLAPISMYFVLGATADRQIRPGRDGTSLPLDYAYVTFFVKRLVR